MNNLANKITLFRLMLVPVIIIISVITQLKLEYYNFVCLALIITFGLGDVLDGYIARKYDQITKIGSFLDPFADKYMVISVLMVLAYYDRIPFWYLLLVFNKDILIFAGWIVLFQKTKKIYLVPNFFGKASTVFQILVIFFAFLSVDRMIVRYLAITSALVTFAAGVGYVIDGLKYNKRAISEQGTAPLE